MSSVVMTFPDTVEEFMEMYKVVDEEHVYTNGTELVPIFRMRQWFEHLKDVVPVVRCNDCGKNPKISMVGCPMAGLNMWTEDGFCSLGEKVTE